jgi:hypothetical protein
MGSALPGALKIISKGYCPSIHSFGKGGHTQLEVITKSRPPIQCDSVWVFSAAMLLKCLAISFNGSVALSAVNSEAGHPI